MSRLEEVISKYANKQEDTEELERKRRQEKKEKGVRKKICSHLHSAPESFNLWNRGILGFPSLEIVKYLTGKQIDIKPFIFRIPNLKRKEKKR